MESMYKDADLLRAIDKAIYDKFKEFSTQDKILRLIRRVEWESYHRGAAECEVRRCE